MDILVIIFIQSFSRKEVALLWIKKKDFGMKYSLLLELFKKYFCLIDQILFK